MTRKRSRRHDVVLFGATGFTGKLVAEYLAEHYGESDVRIALAGRNREKLEAVRNDLKRYGIGDWPILIADSFDRASLDAVAKDTSVVCTTVGPYQKYGAGLVAACVEHGTDYCDLTGETPFIREMVDAHHDRAVQTGARIVHCCGFDSIPSDIGTWMMHREMHAQHDAKLRSVKFFAGESKGGLSGGTVASMMLIAEKVRKDPSLRKLLGHPYALNPPGERSGPDRNDAMGVSLDSDLGMWTGPFVMAAINTRVVRRSNALMGYPYGRDFRYSERMSFGKGPRGMAMASMAAGGITGFMAAAAFEPTRKLLKKRLPDPGEGPSKEAREKGFFVVRLIAKGETRDGREVELRGRVEGKKDPGYGETAKMLGESALCLALDPSEDEGGILTPASAMGDTLLERLRAADMVFRA